MSGHGHALLSRSYGQWWACVRCLHVPNGMWANGASAKTDETLGPAVAAPSQTPEGSTA